METGMIMEKREIFFLLACRGCKSCPAVFEPDDAGKPEEILEGLFRKGLIVNTGERFRVKEPLAGAVKRIAEAKELFCLCHGNRKREILYLYPGERVLAVQEIFLRKKTLRLIFLDKEKLQLFLEEQGILGDEGGWEPLPYVDETVPMLPEKLSDRNELTAYPWVRLAAERIDGNDGQIKEHFGIVRIGFRDELLTENYEKGDVEKEPYTAGRFMEKLLEGL